MRTIQTFSIILIAVITMNCDALTGEEIARISDNQISSTENLDWKTVELDLVQGDKLHFWAEMDMEYEGELGLRYHLQLVHELDTLGFIELDPMDKDITIGEFRTELMDKTNWRFSGRMNTYTVENNGHYTFRTILVSSPNETLDLKKADFVIKK